MSTSLLRLVRMPTLARGIRASNMLNLTEQEAQDYHCVVQCLENIAMHLKPGMDKMSRQRLSRPMKCRINALLKFCLTSEGALNRICIPIRNLAERLLDELSTIYQLQGQLSTNLWTAVRIRGCQFLGPDLQEKVLKLILLVLGDGAELTITIIVLFVERRLRCDFPQVSKNNIGNVVQLLNRASCFEHSNYASSTSFIQLKEGFRTYIALRREHDSQIVEIAQDSGLRFAPEQWSVLLYGDASHKSQMQSVIDKLQAPRHLASYVREVNMAVYRYGNASLIDDIMTNLVPIAALDKIYDGTETMSWARLALVMDCLDNVVTILCEPPPPPLIRDMPFDEIEMLHLFSDQIDQEYDNLFGNQNGDVQRKGNGNNEAPGRLRLPCHDELHNKLGQPLFMTFLKNDEDIEYAAHNETLMDTFSQEPFNGGYVLPMFPPNAFIYPVMPMHAMNHPGNGVEPAPQELCENEQALDLSKWPVASH